MKRILSLLLAVSLCLVGCGSSDSDGSGYTFTTTLSADPECLDPQYSEGETSQQVIATIMEGLLRVSNSATPDLAGASSYTISEDGLTYTFTLREDCYWYSVNFNSTDEAIPVTAMDYVYAFRRLFDPDTNSPYREEFACLANASNIIEGTLDYTWIGVTALSTYELEFTLDYVNPEFLQLLTLTCAFPCNEDFFLSTDGRYGLSVDTILCNGAFYLYKWVYDFYGSDNFLTFYKNKTYYDYESISPSGLTFTIMKSSDNADEDYAEGNSDVILTQTQSLGAKDDTVDSSYSQTLGLIFNPDSEELQNEAFRLALVYSINRSALQSLVSDNICIAYGIIPPAVTVLGTSYREIYADEPLCTAYDSQLAVDYFTAASEELSLNAMNSLRILVSSDFLDTDALLAICQEWQDLFGYYIGLESVSPSEYATRISSGDYSIALYSISPTRNSCVSMLEQFQDIADLLGFVSEEYENILRQLHYVDTFAEAVDYYARAECAILDTLCFVPLFYQNTYLYYTSGNDGFTYDPFASIIEFRNARYFS